MENGYDSEEIRDSIHYITNLSSLISFGHSKRNRLVNIIDEESPSLSISTGNTGETFLKLNSLL